MRRCLLVRIRICQRTNIECTNTATCFVRSAHYWLGMPSPNSFVVELAIGNSTRWYIFAVFTQVGDCIYLLARWSQGPLDSQRRCGRASNKPKVTQKFPTRDIGRILKYEAQIHMRT